MISVHGADVLDVLDAFPRGKTGRGATQRPALNAGADGPDEKVDLADTQRAILNLLEDAAGEKTHLEAMQKAILNILDDSVEERGHLAGMQRAVLNILEDAASQRTQVEATQRAILNILEDSAEEKARLADTQRAALNILADFDFEKTNVERVNADLRNEIAERVRAEDAMRQAKMAAEAASKELETFSYSVAHDLRAPLRSIDGFSHALLEDYADKLDGDGKRYLNYVRDGAIRMGLLIDDLLHLARVARTELRRERVDLSGVAHEVLTRLRESQPSRSVDTVVEDGLVASGDRRLLEVVLVNLLGNAWKFTGKCASARIEFGAQGGRNPVVYFVRDNGAGFDPAYAAKLFGVFQRLHDEGEFEGTGIGLVTVQRIIQRHGGRVWAEGEVDRGATFWFTLAGEGRA
jgi:signal transduction histidine kinase